jgi:hypothetical protein
VMDWFGASTSPLLTPLVLKPAPVAPTEEIVTFALPLFVKIAVSALLLPTLTLPKLRLDVLRPNDFVAASPVPLSAMARGEFGALLLSDIEPLTAPAAVGANTALNVADLPAAILNGALMPVVLKPAPATVIAEIVTVALPPLVRLIVCELLVPVITFPKAALVGVAVSCGWVAVPVRPIVNGELGALLMIEMLPTGLPAEVGANWAVNVVLRPAPSVCGTASPLMLKPVPDAVACETVTFADPEFVNVIVWDPLLPTATEPKLTLAGLALSWPWVPVPDRAIAAGEPGELLTTEMLPVAAPADVGAKVAVNDALLPALIVIGIVAPLILNPAPEAVACVTVRVAFPEFVKVIVWGALLPTATLP